MKLVAIKLRDYSTALYWLGGFVLFAVIITLNRDFTTFLRYLLLGLPQGAVIALIAVGYTMVYGIIQLINFAHGEVFMFSTYFVLMFISAANPTDHTTPVVITCTVAVLFFCAAWMLLGPIHNRWLRALLAFGASALGAWINYMLVPRPGSPEPLPFFAAYGLAVLYSCCLGVAMDLLAYRPLRNSPRLIPLITAIGVSLFLQNFAQSTWGSASRFFPETALPPFFSRPRIDLGHGLAVSRLDLMIIALAVTLMISLQLFILRTRTGKSMRACAQDRVTASLMGIRVNNAVALAFALGAGLAALVAPLYVIRVTPINPQMGYIVGILAFASAVLGGIGNISGAMLGGMIIGIIYSFVPLFDALESFRWFARLENLGWISRTGYNQLITDYGRPGQYQLGVAYAFMILVIVFKPTGLQGRATARRA